MLVVPSLRNGHRQPCCCRIEGCPLSKISHRHRRHRPQYRPAWLVFAFSSLTFLLLTLPNLAESYVSFARPSDIMPDHVRVAVIIDNSSIASGEADLLESAAKFYSFVDKSLIMDQTRLIVSVIRLPTTDVLASTRILCKELQSSSNLAALIVAKIDPSVMSFVVGLTKESHIPLIDIHNDIGRYIDLPFRSQKNHKFSQNRQSFTSNEDGIFKPGYIVYMRPSSAIHITTAVEDLMAAYKWRRMLMLYDTPTSLTQMQKLLGDVGVEGVPAEKAAFRINTSTLFEVSQSIKYRWPTVVVAASEATTAQFLRIALRTGILTTGYSFILCNPNAHFISMEDFAQNSPNVTILRFISESAVSKRILKNARDFEKVESNRYRVLVPDESHSRFDDIPLSSALLLDALTLIRRAFASIYSPEKWTLLATTTPRDQRFNNFVFRSTAGLSCKASAKNMSEFEPIPSKSPYGEVMLKALMTQSTSFEGLTGMVAFNPATHFREIATLDILTLGGVGLKKIGKWSSNAAVIREANSLRIEKHKSVIEEDASMTEKITHLSQLTSKLISARDLRLSIDEEGIHFIRESNVLTNHTIVSTTIKKKTLVVTTVLETPYVMIRKDKSKPRPNSRAIEEHDFDGYCVDLLDEIATLIGFTYKLRVVADGAYGSPNRKTGRWTGMVGEVIEGKADIAVAPLTITYAREQVVDFTKPFMNLGISILYLQPFKEKPSVFSFMQPLAGEIWGYVSISYIVVTLFFYAVGRFSPYEWHSESDSSTGTGGSSTTVSDQFFKHPLNIENHINIFTLGNSSWFTAGTLMQQGSDVSPRAISTRIVGGAWWFFSLIIISSYTANLAAFLTVETVYSPFENAEELSYSSIQYGALIGGSTENFFRESKIDTYRRMWGAMVNKTSWFTKNNTEGINKVRSAAGGYAYLMESVSLEYIVQSPALNKDCDLRQVGGLLDSKGYGIATARESPYRDILSMAILQLQENDRLQLLYNKWWKSSGTCIREENRPKTLGTQNIGGIFAILLIGLFISIISLFFEILWTSRKVDENDERTFWQKFSESFRLLLSFKSRMSVPPKGQRLESKKSSSRSAISLQFDGTNSTNTPQTSGKSRSRSYHEEEIPLTQRSHRHYFDRTPPELPPRPLELSFVDGDDFSQHLLRSGGVLSNLTPRSRANALSLLQTLAQEQQEIMRSAETTSTPSRQRRQHSKRPDSPSRRDRQRATSSRPLVSFEASFNKDPRPSIHHRHFGQRDDDEDVV